MPVGRETGISPGGAVSVFGREGITVSNPAKSLN